MGTVLKYGSPLVEIFPIATRIVRALQQFLYPNCKRELYFLTDPSADEILGIKTTTAERSKR